MNKRDEFIAELREEARRKGLSFGGRSVARQGRTHDGVVGSKLTTVPSREIDPKTARKIRTQLGLAD